MDKLTKRQNMLLRDINKFECDASMEEFIKECEKISQNGQTMYSENKDTENLVKSYIDQYEQRCEQICKNLYKCDPAILDIIIGMPGSGKSRIIKNNDYMKYSFMADADSIKKELSQILNCNINSPQLHELSVNIRNIGMSIAVENKCNIVVEKVGKSEQSINELLEMVGDFYEKNLRLIHCNTAISRIRNAMRFQKYNDESGIVARMIPDEFIKFVGKKPIEVFFSIVHNNEKRNKFNICEAFIQESLYEGNRNVELIDLYNEYLDLDYTYERIKNYIGENIKDGKLIYNILCDIYSTSSMENTNRLKLVEKGDISIINNIIRENLYRVEKENDNDRFTSTHNIF